MSDRVCHHRLAARYRCGEQRQRGGEGQRAEQLLGALVLLQLLQEEDQLHSHRRQPTPAGALETAIREEGAQKGLVSWKLKYTSD